MFYRKQTYVCVDCRGVFRLSARGVSAPLCPTDGTRLLPVHRAPAKGDDQGWARVRRVAVARETARAPALPVSRYLKGRRPARRRRMNRWNP